MIELPCAADIRSNETVTECERPTRAVPRSLRLLRAVLVRALAHESRRTLLALKAHADTID